MKQLIEDRGETYVPAFTLTPEKKELDPNRNADVVHRPNFINDIAAGKVELPTIPAVVQKLMAALKDPNVDARKIAESLAKDPILSAKVLRLANSSFFGGQRSMSSIDAAVSLIGIQALTRLIVACGVAGSFKDIPGIDMAVFWRDSLLAATAANKLAPRLEADPEAAYVCGLLHATGHLILCQTYPEIADLVFTGYDIVRGAELASIENDNFGIAHPEVGALWIESIGFPQPVADSIRKVVQPASPTDVQLDHTLRAACALALAAGNKADAETAFASLPPYVQSKFGGVGGKPDRVFDKLYEALQETDPTF